MQKSESLGSDDQVWKMQTEDPQVIQKHQKNLEYQAKALLANERSIFRPEEKRATND